MDEQRARNNGQELTPLEPQTPVRPPPVARQSSLLQSISNFIGVGNRDEPENLEEKQRWNQKRLRRIANKYNVNSNEAQKIIRQNTYSYGDSTTIFPPEDVERGASSSYAPSHGSRVLAPAASLPMHGDGSSFEQQAYRMDSFSQQDQSRLSRSRLTMEKRESVPAAFVNSVSNLLKKGTVVSKRKLKLQSSLASKCSFDFDVSATTMPEISTPSEKGASLQDESPIGIVISPFRRKFDEEESLEMQAMPKRQESASESKRRMVPASPKSKRLSTPEEKGGVVVISGIPEETSFEIEMAEMEDIDEAHVGELDPSAIPRMTATVRKKSSIRVPPITHVRHSRPASVQIPKSKAGDESSSIERPSSLQQGTRPFLSTTTSLPADVRQSVRKPSFKQSIQDKVVDLLADISEGKLEDKGTDEDEERKIEKPGPSMRKARFQKPQFPFNRSVSIADEVFFDAPSTPLKMPSNDPFFGSVESVDFYHPDIRKSPPTSAELAESSAHYPFDIPDIKFGARTPSTQQYRRPQYRQDAGITYIDVGDSNIVQPQSTSLGGFPRPKEVTIRAKPDRPILPGESASSHNILIRQQAVSDLDDRGVTRKLNMKKALHQVAKMYSEKPKSRERGIGALGDLFGRTTKPKKQLPPKLREYLDAEVDERPWFTYWVTSVQIIVSLLSIVSYGIAPTVFKDFELYYQVDGDALDPTMTVRRISYEEPVNVWLGPRYADLVRMGAKYSPCMRRETKLWEAIEEDRRKENQTGCCIAYDKSGCYQSSEQMCPHTFARWVRWDKKHSLRKPSMLRKSKSEGDLLSRIDPKVLIARERTSGAVCGQDPMYCENPASIAPHEWPDDLTKWPICEKTREGAGLPEHMTCQVTGRPCCFQLQGLCRIATKEYCDFVNGKWHPNATLCSQVNCFADVCGMFFVTKTPFQFYRFLTSLFIHAGILHQVITATIQIWLMRDLEKLIGSVRTGFLYFIAGVGGNLASAIFSPYSPEVGPSGALSGIIAALIVDVHHHRKLIENVNSAYFQHAILTVALLLLGVFPFIDNWAHIFGSIFGFLTAIVTFPYIDFLNDESCMDEKPNHARDPMTPNSILGSPTNTAMIITSAEGYSQLETDLQSPSGPAFITGIPTYLGSIMDCATSFVTKRTFYVIIAVIIESSLFIFLLIVFFKNIELNWRWMENINCISLLFKCENQGQALKKLLPI